MSSKSAKKQAKAAKRARREAARRAERRRNLISLAIVVGVVVVGGGLIGLTLYQEQQAEAEAAAELEAMQSEAASEAAAQAARVQDRPVACAAEVPAAASEPAATPSETATTATEGATEAPQGGRIPSAPPPGEEVLEEGVDYAAVIETSCGTVELDLAEDRAPETVAAFVDLARQGFYDGLEIFRNATSIGALQTGSGNDTAAYDAGFSLDDELGYAQEDGYPPGAVAMANSGPDTSSTQFFFVYNDAFDEAFADNRAYTRFATVTDGLEVLADIGAIETMDPPEEQSQLSETPSEIVYMESVEIVENSSGG